MTNLPPAHPHGAEKRYRIVQPLVGASLGLVLAMLAEQLLGAEYVDARLFEYGRIGLVVLFGYMGHLFAVGRGRAVAENIECLAIAIAMALILKHFLVEAYKIPTGSMQPTIIGNDKRGIFDRVLVNKFAYLVDEPRRYEVIVFKFPLNRSQNYIKRLIGLPNERITIQNGNIYVASKQPDGSYGASAIARKPDKVRRSVMKTLYPSRRPGENFASSFTVDSGTATQDGDAVVLAGDARFHFGKGGSILDKYLDGYDPAWDIPAENTGFAAGRDNVGDLLVEFDCELETASTIECLIDSFGRQYRARVGTDAAGSCELLAATPSGDATLPLPGEASTTVARCDSPVRGSKSLHVCFFHVDQQLVLEIDGERVLHWEYEIREPLQDSENRVEVAIAGGARLTDLEVQRDIHYLTGNSSVVSDNFDVPSDSLFAMGDNTQNSHDGRMWSSTTYRMPDGREVTRETSLGAWAGDFVDVFGERYDARDFAGYSQTAAARKVSFIPRELLLGKAIAVFWPIFPHFRWKLIR